MEALSVEGTMFWNRLRFFLQLMAISRLMLRCTLRLKEATPSIELNSSKCSLSCEVYRRSITPAIPLCVSHTTLSTNSSCSPIAHISNLRRSYRLGCFILTMGIWELSLNYPSSTTPRAESQVISSLRLYCPTTNSFFSQQFSTLDFKPYLLNAAVMEQWQRLICGYRSKGRVLTRHLVIHLMLDVR